MTGTANSSALATGPDADEIDTTVERTCGRHGDRPGALLEILHDLHQEMGGIPEPALAGIARRLNLSRADVHGVASFYPDFRKRPREARVVRLCRAEACQSMGAEELIATLRARHGGAVGDAAGDGWLTIEPVYCLGLCAVAPAGQIDGRPHGRLDPARVERLMAETDPAGEGRT